MRGRLLTGYSYAMSRRLQPIAIAAFLSLIVVLFGCAKTENVPTDGGPQAENKPAAPTTDETPARN
jgi:hypothetical protein